MVANPNPARITTPMWRLWEDRPVAAWRLGGIYANKSGYHNTRDANRAGWPDNYSIRLSLDLQGPGDKAAAIDYTMSDAEMRKRTGYLVAAAGRRDPRLFAVREFYGTVDSKKVVGRIKTTRTGGWSASSSDSSHLWHIHASLFRSYVDTWSELAPVLSVLAGETLAQWQSGTGGIEDMFCKLGDKGNAVRALQLQLRRAGFDPGEIDADYGPATSAALLAMRKSVGSSATSGDAYDAWGYDQLSGVLLRKHAGQDGDPGPRGAAGPPGPGPTQAQISQAVDGWLVQHVEVIRGPEGPPGKTPTKVAISGDVIEAS